MIERLVWNFEYSTDKSLPLSTLKKEEEASEHKWEARFFWQQFEIITLCATDDGLLNLTQYKQKHREDTYYLVPDTNYNIKHRRNELLYKPIINQTDYATSFAPKINLGEASKNNPALEKIRKQTEKAAIVHVIKDAFIYKFNTIPATKLELARLEVANAVYFSACIEGKSASLVQQISKHLLDGHFSCDYVTFLKTIVKS
jgi:hypothetical protein